MPSSPAITLAHGQVSFGDVNALCDVSLTVNQGETCVLLGESGSGKTTLLRVFAGLQRLDSGRLSVGGTIVDDHKTFVPPERRSTGVVFQNYALFPHLTVEENVAFGAASKPFDANALLTQLGLSGLGPRSVAALSGGQQQRVALARVLAQEPTIALLDEPFSNFNRDLRRTLRDLTLRAVRNAGATCVLVTHDPAEALGVADRVAVVREGRVLQFDTPAIVYARPTSLACALATGDANFVPVDAPDNADVSPDEATQLLRRGNDDAPRGMMIRPEQLALVDPSQGVVAHVTQREFTGPTTTITAQIEAGPTVRVAVPAHTAPSGERVGIRCLQTVPVVDR